MDGSSRCGILARPLPLAPSIPLWIGFTAGREFGRLAPWMLQSTLMGVTGMAESLTVIDVKDIAAVFAGQDVIYLDRGSVYPALKAHNA